MSLKRLERLSVHTPFGRDLEDRELGIDRSFGKWQLQVLKGKIRGYATAARPIDKTRLDELGWKIYPE